MIEGESEYLIGGEIIDVLIVNLREQIIYRQRKKEKEREE